MLKSTYLASGTYGCVAKPAFKCDNRNETTDNTIMKLFADKDNYKEEIKKQMQIQTIDPESNFTIKMISKCETDINFINTRKLTFDIPEDFYITSKDFSFKNDLFTNIITIN